MAEGFITRRGGVSGELPFNLLYSNGNEFTNVTGGYVLRRSGSISFFNKTSNSLEFGYTTGSGGDAVTATTISTNDLIDLTNINQVVFDFESTTNTSTHRNNFFVAETIQQMQETLVENAPIRGGAERGAVERSLIVLDVSEITGNYYIGANTARGSFTTSHTGKINIYNIFLL